MDGSPKRRQRKYFDIKTFRQHLRRQKVEEIKEEDRQVAEAYAKPPPHEWTIEIFLQEIKIGENWEDIASLFHSWNQFISSTQVAKPLLNESKEWTEADDKRLIELADLYNVNFGDPWLYISWEMQRDMFDVLQRYTQIRIIPQNLRSSCSITITKASRPLLMNRYFKLDPPLLYIIPSETHFPLSQIPFYIPDKFTKYRCNECFESKPRQLSVSRLKNFCGNSSFKNTEAEENQTDFPEDDRHYNGSKP
ncbi:hypothetical protein IE077_002698 [Cardiosporidium cionae]|uniref:Myb-like domain-containing protein n=1 Tax=Cardiosporidium cionae TaxID=476202 RepID=A0ABQ7JFG5_9APIC|nr:hypothetical protein IE077_002698 [Cardiosporidium cionae]|eukprot:KAF8822767.1 hypothetical protein IE077_002698 [Cardiosporidium cionae]